MMCLRPECNHTGSCSGFDRSSSDPSRITRSPSGTNEYGLSEPDTMMFLKVTYDEPAKRPAVQMGKGRTKGQARRGNQAQYSWHASTWKHTVRGESPHTVVPCICSCKFSASESWCNQ